MIETANSMKVGIGTEGTVLLEGLAVAVRVVDMRQRWGTMDALIRPINGHGEKWIEARRVLVTIETENRIEPRPQVGRQY